MASTTNMARRKRNNDINIGDILQDVMWKGKASVVGWLIVYQLSILSLSCSQYKPSVDTDEMITPT